MKKIEIAEWILKIGIFGTFLGHGVFALLGKESWLHYFPAVGITEATGLLLLPLIGIMDIAIAAIVIYRPYKIILIWATIWAFVTALIRPIAGEPIWDFVERSSNWAAPLALLSIYGFPKKAEELFKV
jgi:hypothetical protein